jgi:hypothetical protein
MAPEIWLRQKYDTKADIWWFEFLYLY